MHRNGAVDIKSLTVMWDWHIQKKIVEAIRKIPARYSQNSRYKTNVYFSLCILIYQSEFYFAFKKKHLFTAFATRLFSVLRFESVIHEFDPYFNYRTTRYLTEEGFYNFHNWFDDRAWYPLGRIIGGKFHCLYIYTNI